MNISDIFDFTSPLVTRRGKSGRKWEVEGSRCHPWQHLLFSPPPPPLPFFNIYPMQMYENFPAESSLPGVSSFAFVLPRQQLGRKGDNQACVTLAGIKFIFPKKIYKNRDQPVTTVDEYQSIR